MKPILLDSPMPIITPGLLLRPPQIGDGVVVNEAILESFDALNKFMDWAKEKPSIEDSEIYAREAAANWILKKNDEPYLPLYMFDNQTNQFIGATGYHHYDWDVASIEIGYWIRRSASGKGLMTEAVIALTRYAFQQLNMRRVTITCDIDNTRSKKIPESLGYILQDVLKENRRKPITNEISDTLVYSRYNLDGLADLTVTWGDDSS